MRWALAALLLAACGSAGPAAPVAAPCPLQPGGFTNCIETSGIDVAPGRPATALVDSSGALVADLDEDGLPEIFYWSVSTAGLYHNEGGFEFRNVLAGSGLDFPVTVGDAGLCPISAGAVGDLDDDGHVDVVLVLGADDAFQARQGRAPRPPMNRLGVYRNDGRGHFTDVTGAWGFGAAPLPDGLAAFGTNLTLADLNGDGRLDVVESRHEERARTLLFLSQPGLVWKEQGDAVFPRSAGLTWSTGFYDWNHDGLLDYLLLNDKVPGPSQPTSGSISRLYLRDGGGGLVFKEQQVPLLFGTAASLTPMGMATGDFDGDGRVDLVLTDSGLHGQLGLHVLSAEQEISGALGLAPGPGKLEHYLEQTGWTPAPIDLDNDGQLDLFASVAPMTDNFAIRHSTILLHRTGAGFEDANALLREQPGQRENGAVVADLDGGGRADIVTSVFKQRPRLLRNEIAAGHSLTVRLRGTRANSEGLGALVTVEAAGIAPQTFEVSAGGATVGYGPASRVVGIGAADFADRITVRWAPAGGTAVQELTHVAAGPVQIVEP